MGQTDNVEPASVSPASKYWSREEGAGSKLVDIYSDLSAGRDEAKSVFQSSEHKPRIFSLATYGSFFAGIPSTARVIARSPEVLVFAVAQWLVIVLGYLVWTHVLRLIPDEVWNAVEDAVRRDDHSPEFALCNLVLLAWTFLVVCAVSYPLGLCSAGMVAVNDLRASNKEVTFARCIAVADRHLGRIWAFTIVDSWITVWAIVGAAQDE
jgi:hypothetical protein